MAAEPSHWGDRQSYTELIKSPVSCVACNEFDRSGAKPVGDGKQHQPRKRQQRGDEECPLDKTQLLLRRIELSHKKTSGRIASRSMRQCGLTLRITVRSTQVSKAQQDALDRVPTYAVSRTGLRNTFSNPCPDTVTQHRYTH